MSEYIDRTELLKRIRWASSPEECIISVRRMPAANVRPMSHGIGIATSSNSITCSCCNYVFNKEAFLQWRYCPKCGADIVAIN